MFTTDGRIVALDLKVLEDDRQFFPNYNAALTVRGPVMKANPQIADLFAAVSRKLDDKTLVTLNARIDVDGQDPGEVALSWLVSQGFVTRT